MIEHLYFFVLINLILIQSIKHKTTFICFCFDSIKTPAFSVIKDSFIISVLVKPYLMFMILSGDSLIFKKICYILQKMQEDQLKVEDTNEQALASKISAIKKGYFVDNFAEEFTLYRGKRDIIIHRGYWARVFIVRKLIETMIQHGGDVQIVSLGCGLQTIWFNLMDEGHIQQHFKFVQLDLESVVKKKIRKINHSKKLAKLFQKIHLKPQISQHQHLFKLGDAYTLTVCDLSNTAQFQKILQDHKIDTTIPTFFYSQCVLSYIDADKVDEFVSYIKNKFNLAFIFDYQMYNPNDRFGQLMVKNFDLRGCPLIGMHKYPNLSDQHLRYTNAGFKNTEVFTMLQIYYDCIDKSERLKIQKIQMLDQLQEWNLIMAHYFGLLSTTFNQEGQKHPCFQELIKYMRLKH